MKKRILGLCVIVLVLFVCIFGRGVYFYGKYTVPNKNYFGTHYTEVLYPMSFQDKKQAKEIMGIIGDAFSFIGNREESENKFGVLCRYCVTEEDEVTEKHDLKLITADFDKNNGYLWFVYDQQTFDSNNQLAMASLDVLVRAELEKTEQGWVVVDTKEHP